MGNRLNVSHGGTPRTKRLSSLTGLEVKQFFSTSGRGRSIFLDIPLYRSGDCAQNPVNECNGDLSPTAIILMMLPDLVTTPYKLDQEFGRQGTSVRSEERR